MTIENLIELLQQFPKDTVVVLPKHERNRHPKVASVSFYKVDYDKRRDAYYEIDGWSIPEDKVKVLIINGEEI